MAGSYNHVVTDHGNLASNKTVSEMLENGGDVYEAVEEMFGMIWWLAAELVNSQLFALVALNKDNLPERAQLMKQAVEKAKEEYKEGLEVSKHIHRISPDKRRT